MSLCHGKRKPANLLQKSHGKIGTFRSEHTDRILKVSRTIGHDAMLMPLRLNIYYANQYRKFDRSAGTKASAGLRINSNPFSLRIFSFRQPNVLFLPVKPL
jgi:hypothetical protein